MTIIPIDHATTNINQLVADLQPGEEILLTRNQQPVARIIGVASNGTGQKRQLGTMQGTVIEIADDAIDTDTSKNTNVLELAQEVYSGLSDQEIDEIERIATDRSKFFSTKDK